MLYQSNMKSTSAGVKRWSMTHLFTDAYDGTPIDVDKEDFYLNIRRPINHAIVHEWNIEEFIATDERYGRPTSHVIKEDYRQVLHRPKPPNPYGISIVPYNEFLKFLDLFVSRDVFRNHERRFDDFLRRFV